jgi:hypothetical protein
MNPMLHGDSISFFSQMEVKLANNNNVLYLRADPTPNRQLQNHYCTKHKQTKRITLKVKKCNTPQLSNKPYLE